MEYCIAFYSMPRKVEFAKEERADKKRLIQDAIAIFELSQKHIPATKTVFERDEDGAPCIRLYDGYQQVEEIRSERWNDEQRQLVEDILLDGSPSAPGPGPGSRHAPVAAAAAASGSSPTATAAAPAAATATTTATTAAAAPLPAPAAPDAPAAVPVPANDAALAELDAQTKAIEQQLLPLLNATTSPQEPDPELAALRAQNAQLLEQVRTTQAVMNQRLQKQEIAYEEVRRERQEYIRALEEQLSSAKIRAQGTDMAAASLRAQYEQAMAKAQQAEQALDKQLGTLQQQKNALVEQLRAKDAALQSAEVALAASQRGLYEAQSQRQKLEHHAAAQTDKLTGATQGLDDALKKIEVNCQRINELTQQLQVAQNSREKLEGRIAHQQRLLDEAQNQLQTAQQKTQAEVATTSKQQVQRFNAELTVLQLQLDQTKAKLQQAEKLLVQRKDEENQHSSKHAEALERLSRLEQQLARAKQQRQTLQKRLVVEKWRFAATRASQAENAARFEELTLENERNERMYAVARQESQSLKYELQVVKKELAQSPEKLAQQKEQLLQHHETRERKLEALIQKLEEENSALSNHLQKQIQQQQKLQTQFENQQGKERLEYAIDVRKLNQKLENLQKELDQAQKKAHENRKLADETLDIAEALQQQHKQKVAEALAKQRGEILKFQYQREKGEIPDFYEDFMKASAAIDAAAQASGISPPAPSEQGQPAAAASAAAPAAAANK